MYKKLKADKDSYITNKLVKSVSRVSASTGQAATLDLFKLYDATRTNNVPNTEISRLLVHFDMSPLDTLISQSRVDINDSSFWCNLVLKDVYGGQPTPVNFNVNVFPLSASFSEGLGRDVVYYSDTDVCNWLSSSLDNGEWYSQGCNSGAAANIAADYIISSDNIASTLVTQKFVTGEEDLIVDVTKIVSATLKKEIPDSGFRISFTSQIESDNKSYFVKRFGSRHIYDESKRPYLEFGFNDSITDDTQNLYFDENLQIKLYNYSQGQQKNLFFNGSEVTGSDCIKLKLQLLPNLNYELTFTGSQQKIGDLYQDGIYTSTFFLSSSNSNYNSILNEDGVVEFQPVWFSFNNAHTFLTGSKIKVRAPLRGSARRDVSKYVVSVLGLKDQYDINQEDIVRVNVFDYTNPFMEVVKLPVELPGIVVKNAYYCVRETVTDSIAIPFDTIKKSTKISSDSNGMFFTLDTSSLIAGRNYVIDIMIDDNGRKQYFYNASSRFSITSNGTQK